MLPQDLKILIEAKSQQNSQQALQPRRQSAVGCKIPPTPFVEPVSQCRPMSSRRRLDVMIHSFRRVMTWLLGHCGVTGSWRLHLPTSLSWLTSRYDINNSSFTEGSNCDATSQLVLRVRFTDICSNSYRSHKSNFIKWFVKILWEFATTHWLAGFSYSNPP